MHKPIVRGELSSRDVEMAVRANVLLRMADRSHIPMRVKVTQYSFFRWHFFHIRIIGHETYWLRIHG
jgi:hypothetical protein